MQKVRDKAMVKNTKTVRRLKFTDYELRVAINALNAYRIKQKNCGVDNSATSNLILRLLDILEA